MMESSEIKIHPEVKNNQDKYSQGVERYKQVLLEYKNWLKEREKDGTDNTPEVDRESKLRNAYIDGMVAALNLSYEQELEIMKKIKFIHTDKLMETKEDIKE